jgi:hypothetical protein
VLQDVCLARRQDAVEVIGEALLCSAREGYRPVAEDDAAFVLAQHA